MIELLTSDANSGVSGRAEDVETGETAAIGSAEELIDIPLSQTRPAGRDSFEGCPPALPGEGCIDRERQVYPSDTSPPTRKTPL